MVEGVLANIPTYLVDLKAAFGSTFVCAGQVVFADDVSLKRFLTSPQARTTQLGVTMLERDSLPSLDIGERLSLMIVLSEQQEGGNGDFEAFVSAFKKYMFNDAAKARQKDATAKKLLDCLAQDYVEMPHGRGTRVLGFVEANGTSFFVGKQGLSFFLVKYLHYVLFGLDPTDEKTMNKLYALLFEGFAGAPLVGLYFAKFGLPNLVWPPQMNAVQKIYEQSPALATFESTAEIKYMTRSEYARTAIALMAIAGILGPYNAAQSVMGFAPFPSWPGTELGSVDVRPIWDELDLSDQTALRSFIMECLRVSPPVSTSHYVTTKPLKARVAGWPRTFPVGTQGTTAMNVGGVDPDIWGPSVGSFDAARPNLEADLMAFHSVGRQAAGRRCLGEETAMTMLADMLAVVGAARRALPANP